MAIEAGSLVKGKTYKVKYQGEERATSRMYIGDFQSYVEDANGELVEGEICAHFNSTRGGNKFYLYAEIVSAVEIKAKVKSAEQLKECSRCNGSGVLPWLTHVEGGRCFGCGGIGKI